MWELQMPEHNARTCQEMNECQMFYLINGLCCGVPSLNCRTVAESGPLIDMARSVMNHLSWNILVDVPFLSSSGSKGR